MTIYDIAKLAGVSKSTVSRVLNGETNVSADAKGKVEAVIREHNYVPNRSASMTKKNREVILVLVTRLDSYSETRLIRGMMEAANQNIEFLIAETQFDIEKTKSIVRNNKNVSGIVVFAISGANYQFLEELLIPVVIVGQNIGTKCNNLFFDDYNSMSELVVKTGIQKPIFIGYNPEDLTMMRRYQAVCDSLNKEIEYIKMSSYGHMDTASNFNINDYDSFICSTETIALEIYRDIIKNNIKDYQILSAGNNKNINFIIENFSTIDFHYKRGGKFIIENLKTKGTFKHVTQYNVIEAGSKR